MITSDLFGRGRPRCPICQQPGHACGESHMRRGPADNTAPQGASMSQPQELREYQYIVNNMITTALLTEEMAQRLGAVPVGQTPSERNGGYTSAKNAVHGTTHMSAAVEGGHATGPVREQQQGVDERGRTASARRTIHDYPDTRPAEGEDGEPDSEDEKAASSPNKARRTAKDK